MADLPDILALINAAGQDGRVELDTRVLSLLLDVLACSLLVVVAVILVVGILFVRWLRQRAGTRPGSGLLARTEDSDVSIKLRSQLAEMVRKTNERNNYVNSIFASIEDGLILVDPEGRVVLYNPKAMDLLGLGPEVFFARREAEMAAAEPLASILASCRQVSSTRHPELLELSNAQNQILEVRVGPITDKYDSSLELGVLAVAKDVTEFRRLENLKKDFVANVSHEFRTPLTLIAGFVEMFRIGRPMPDSDRNRAFEIMEIETERLKRLVSELLTLSEMESELPLQAETLFEPDRVLKDLIASMESLASKKDQRINSDLKLAGVSLKGNEHWFYLAAKNLVENAIKYTPEGGRIELESGVEDGLLVFSVSDTGIGIPPLEQDRIFERFYRIEKARGSGSGGSGLGLALVKDIAEMFGGSVEVRSNIGQGSRFTLRLPLERSGTGNVIRT